MATPKRPVLHRRIRSAVRAYRSRPDLSDVKTHLNNSPDFTAGISQKILVSNILRYGGPFMGAFKQSEFMAADRRFRMELAKTSYESPIGILLSAWDTALSDFVHLGRAKLGFDRGAVCIEAVQGERGTIKSLKALESAVSNPWPNLLIKKIEGVARRMGYSEVRFRDVETLHYFKEPEVHGRDIERYKENHPKAQGFSLEGIIERIQVEIRARMKKFYNKIYAALGYKKRTGDYWVKKL